MKITEGRPFILYLDGKEIARGKESIIEDDPLEIFEYIGLIDGAHVFRNTAHEIHITSPYYDKAVIGSKFEYIPAWMAHDWTAKFKPL